MINQHEEPRLGNSLIFVALLALALRIPMINGGLWFDEIRMLTEFGRLPLGELLTTYGSDNNHPLYTLLAWVSTHIFGEQAWALRLPALIFGILSLFALAQLAALLTDRKSALFITFLAAISYHHIWFSDNARGYTALLFFTLAGTHELICLLDDRGRVRLLTYALSMALATWVHTTAIFVALAHFFVIWFMSGRARPRGMLGLIMAGIFSLILHAPILGEMVTFLTTDRGFKAVSSSWSNPIWTVVEALRTFGIAPWLAAVVCGIGFFFLALSIRELHRIDRRLPWLFLLPGVLGTLAMVAMNRNIWPRFYFNLLGFLLIMAVITWRSMATWIEGRFPQIPFVFLGGAALMVIASLAILPPALTTPKQDYEGAANFLDQKQAEGATIISLGLASKPLQNFLNRPYSFVTTIEELNSLLAKQKTTFAVNTLPTFLESRSPKVAQALKEKFTLIKTFPGTVGGGALKIYQLQTP